MEEATLAFLLQKEITSEGKITVPDEVRKLLFAKPESEENRYMWNYDRENNYIILSNESLREKQSSWKQHTEAEKDNPRRTTVPVEFRNKFDLEKGDDLYFTTPEAVRSGLPAVFVWTFDQIEEIILEGAEKVESGFPRQPHF